MAGTLFDLYLKYRNRVERNLENDSYYQYLFELLQSSPNVIEQTNRILHKNVDERWLTRVEEGITAIDAIINKPRRFIKTEESIVPIELARKISSESVKHLSRNTQFISDIDEAGNVRPSRILNITTQESYDLYENRFIHTLIKKLVQFIDKRTDIIFWSTGDETESMLSVNSQMEDDYEQIEYTLQMRVKNKQSYMENDAANMEVFKRIDRVRRIVMEFNRSPFMQVMAETAKVRSPIQRTNLIMKDPNYKKCYTLWAFLEQYDDVGYTIDVKETALEFDEDYLYGLYNNMILNYTVFKTLLDDDRRPIDENVKKRKKIKPKFVKQIVEEFVDDYDIPDVEIRKVIIEEITKAQAEIERRQAEAEKRKAVKAKEAEKKRIAREKEAAKAKAERDRQKAKEKAEHDKMVAAVKAAEAKARAKEREEEKKEKARLKAEADREKARLAEEAIKEKERIAAEKEKARITAEKEKEKARIVAEKEKEKAKIAAAKEKEKVRLAAEKAKAVEKAKLEREKQREKARLEKEKEKAHLKAEADREKARLKAEEAKEKEKVRLAAEKEKAVEQARLEKEKAAEKARLEKEKAAEKARLEKEKAAEKARLEKEKAAEKARLEKEKAAEKAKMERKKQREKERLEKEKEKARLTAEAEKEKARLAAEAEKEKARLAAEAEKEKAAEESRIEAKEEQARLASQLRHIKL